MGGTSLSLQLGHRISIDIDLFTDATYGSIDFSAIDNYLRQHFPYVSPSALSEIVGMGVSYIVVNDVHNAFKLDLYYTDPFIWNTVEIDNIRLASVEEIIAMKIDIIQRDGRKKDFWDLHELSDNFSVSEMITFHQTRYPYTHDEAIIIKNLVNFSEADNDFDPECLKGKHWELVKFDMTQFAATLSNNK